MSARDALLLAVDGGNSKTDLALVSPDGTVRAAGRGPTVSHQQVGLEAAASRLRRLVDAAVVHAGLDVDEPVAALGVLCLAGVDLPSDERALRAAHGRTGITAEMILENDTVAGLWAGSPEGWGVGVVLGEGINAIGISPSGRRARFAGLGPISGDRGGGSGLGMWALGAAVRAQDGRGPRTTLERAVPGHFGVRRPLDVTTAIYGGRIDEDRLAELAPVAVREAVAGDAVALGLIDELAAACAEFATAAIGRLRMTRLGVPVVLSGGVARGAADLLRERVEARVRVLAPGAGVTVLHDPPVLGAALLALHRSGITDPAAAARLRAGLRHDTLTASPLGDPIPGGDR